jgi:putative glycosyltransferase (TIGR04372 family)
VEGKHGAKRILVAFGGPRVSNAAVANRLNPTVFAKDLTRSIPDRVLSWIADHPLLVLPTLEAVAQMPSPVFALDPSAYPRLLVERHEDTEAFQDLALRLGLEPSIPIACVHVRTEGYSTVDDAVQAHRNFEVSSILEAIELLTAAGLQVVRVGGPFGEKLPSWVPAVDYAFSATRSPENDFLLVSRCKMFIGSTSGLYVLATMFGRPTLGLNMTPINAFGMVGSRTMSIPKLVYSEVEGRILTFAEAAKAPSGNSLAQVGLAAECLRPIDNSKDEIADAVADFIALNEQEEWKLCAEDLALQEAFRRAIPDDAYGARSSTLVAPSFLRRHVSLLPVDR